MKNHRGQIAPENLRRYVYLHIDPMNGNVIYVGKGTGGRAWDCAYTSRHHKTHYAYLVGLLEKGYTPAVQIVKQNLDEKDAQKLEKELIEKYKKVSNPFFNLLGCVFHPTLTLPQFQECRRLRSLDISYFKIAAAVGTSTMTAWRALNSETKAYMEIYL